MWQECQITLQHTRPCYAKSSYRSVDPQTLHGNVHQADHVPSGPTNSAVTTICSNCDSVEASHWSRSLESDATVPADYALTTTTTQRKILRKPRGPVGGANLRFRSYQPVTSLYCRATDAGLVHRVVWLFTFHPAETGTYIPTPRHGRLSWLSWLFLSSIPGWFTHPKTVTHPCTNRA